MQPIRHWSYAVQWWSFAVVLLVLWAVVSRKCGRWAATTHEHRTPEELRARNLRMLAVLAGLFLLPLLLAFWVYYGTDWRPVRASITAN